MPCMQQLSLFLDVTKTNEGPSMSELERGFFTDCNLSSLSVEGMLRSSKGIIVEYPDSNPTLPVWFNYSSSVLSPSSAPSKNSLLSPGNTLNTGLNGLAEDRSSTPYERVTFQKPGLASSLDLSCIDLTTSHPLWEVSLIKPCTESPKPGLNPNKLEPAWSPSYQSAPRTLAEISSLVWSGRSLGKSVTEDHQRSCLEATFQESNRRHAVLELADEQQKSVPRDLPL
ncbi:uncharacterized protein si:ch73-303b9.1 [Electrophorus electricus]|uniref:uncharacterized protein si:ch73-303b9.1 n=1 Tax=Electrophorus electricus TaxID=8005 RepID=UPI0015CFDD19|nr:uncharacterized protein si:ch73-303b9.1 [Electrophorus electricus]